MTGQLFQSFSYPFLLFICFSQSFLLFGFIFRVGGFVQHFFSFWRRLLDHSQSVIGIAGFFQSFLSRSVLSIGFSSESFSHVLEFVIQSFLLLLHFLSLLLDIFSFAFIEFCQSLFSFFLVFPGFLSELFQLFADCRAFLIYGFSGLLHFLFVLLGSPGDFLLHFFQLFRNIFTFFVSMFAVAEFIASLVGFVFVKGFIEVFSHFFGIFILSIGEFIFELSKVFLSFFKEFRILSNFLAGIVFIFFIGDQFLNIFFGFFELVALFQVFQSFGQLFGFFSGFFTAHRRVVFRILQSLCGFSEIFNKLRVGVLFLFFQLSSFFQLSAGFFETFFSFFGFFGHFFFEFFLFFFRLLFLYSLVQFIFCFGQLFQVFGRFFDLLHFFFEQLFDLSSGPLRLSCIVSAYIDHHMQHAPEVVAEVCQVVFFKPGCFYVAFLSIGVEDFKLNA